MIAHFKAHTEPIGSVCFSATGVRVATASVDGHSINVFSLKAGHSSGPPGAYEHWYELSRGITPSIIQVPSFDLIG